MYKDILFTVDLGHESSWKKALPIAVEYAKTFGSTLHVMTVVPDFGMSIVGQFFPEDFAQKALDGAAAKLQAFKNANVPDGIPVQDIVASGVIYDEILATAKQIDADLIVIGAHRPDLKNHLLGPNAARVARHSEHSVLVVRD